MRGKTLQHLFYCCALALLALALPTLVVRPASAQLINPPASTVQLPVFGVAVDPDGLFEVKLFAQPGGQLFMERALAARAKFPANIFKPSKLRKVSLRRLEAALQQQISDGGEPTEMMTHLAGLTRIEYVFVLPESNDIVIAGPAEGWVHDAADRAIGIHSGLPIILLEDLLTAIRVFQNAPPQFWVGCSIGPSADSLKNLREVQAALPDRIPRSAEAEVAQATLVAIEDALGLANVMVFGVPAETHMAQVMVEADYRMKLIAIGRESPPIDMPTFFSELKRPGKNLLQRWWFTPDYQRMQMSADRLNLQMTGADVVLGTEDYKIGTRGELIKMDNKPGGASRAYSQAFTKRYSQIAMMSPVFAQLRNAMDLLVVAAFLDNEDSYESVDWKPELLLDEEQLPTKTLVAPTNAPFVANVAWRSGRMIAPSGGVCILAEHALEPSNLKTLKRDSIDGARKKTSEQLESIEDWWWD